jgi:hypothetical protein
MLSKSLFDGKKLHGNLGDYPFTAESLFRIGLALCTYLVIKGEEKPILGVNVLDFATMSLAVGFMAGGGDVVVGEGNISVIHREEENALIFEGLEEIDLKKIESILFSRYNIPKKRGKEVGRLWIQEKKP